MSNDDEELSLAQGTVLASLAVIGGVDSRPRLGGLVSHPEWNMCTISRIMPNGRITIRCHESGAIQNCRLNELSVVSLTVHILLFQLLFILFFDSGLPTTTKKSYLLRFGIQNTPVRNFVTTGLYFTENSKIKRDLPVS